jgi:hypothetical protein
VEIRTDADLPSDTVIFTWEPVIETGLSICTVQLPSIGRPWAPHTLLTAGRSDRTRRRASVAGSPCVGIFHDRSVRPVERLSCTNRSACERATLPAAVCAPFVETPVSRKRVVLPAEPTLEGGSRCGRAEPTRSLVLVTHDFRQAISSDDSREDREHRSERSQSNRGLPEFEAFARVRPRTGFLAASIATRLSVSHSPSGSPARAL